MFSLHWIVPPIALGGLLFGSLVHAQQITLGPDATVAYAGELGTELGYFPRKALSPSQPEAQVALSAGLDLTLQSPWPTELRAKLRTFFDPDDHHRDRALLIDDLYVDYFAPRWELRAGIQTQSFRTVESVSPADILNQTDGERNLFDPEKIGEPMVRALLLGAENRSLGLFYLPFFTPARMPRSGSRFDFLARDPVRSVSNNPALHTYSSHLGRGRPQIALRLAGTVAEAFDLALYYFNGYRRFPSQLRPSRVDPNLLAHHYQALQQGGLTAQGALGPWLLKAETAYVRNLTAVRSLSGKTVSPFLAYTAGFEYTLSSVTGDHDLGVIAEAIGDTDTDKDDDDLDGFRPFRNHLFGALRYTFNDASDRSVMGGSFVDYRRGGFLYRVEFQQRVWGSAVLEVGIFGGAPSDAGPLNDFKRALLLSSKLHYHW